MTHVDCSTTELRYKEQQREQGLQMMNAQLAALRKGLLEKV